MRDQSLSSWQEEGDQVIGELAGTDRAESPEVFWESSTNLGLEYCENYAVKPLFFLSFSFIYARPPVLGTTLNCIIMPHDYYNNT